MDETNTRTDAPRPHADCMVSRLDDREEHSDGEAACRALLRAVRGGDR